MSDQLAHRLLNRMGLGSATWRTLVVTASADTDLDPGRIWRTWANVDNWPSLSSRVSAVRWMLGQPWRAGSEFVEEGNRGFTKRKTRAAMRVISVDVGQAAEWVGIRTKPRTAQLWRFEERGSGARVTRIAVFYGSSIGVLKPLLARRWRQVFEAEINALMGLARMET